MASNQDAPHPTSIPSPEFSATEPDPATPRRSFLVGLIVTSVFVATLGMVTFIWYRWHGVQEPTTAIIIDGDASLDGTIINVRGGPRQISATLKASNSYTAVLLVEPGRYWVHALRDGSMLLRKEVQVKRFLGVRFNLAEFLKAQQQTAERNELSKVSAEPIGSGDARVRHE